MKKYIFLILINGFLILCLAAAPVSEYSLKGAYIYKFLFFVEWPEEAFVNSDSIIIGILGKAPYASILKLKEGEIINGKKLVIKQFYNDTPSELLKSCHLLFIDPSMRIKMGQLLDSLKSHPVLTVSDIGGFGNLGGMINLVVRGDSVKFEINKAAAERVGIKVRSKLLRLAIRIIEENHAGNQKKQQV